MKPTKTSMIEKVASTLSSRGDTYGTPQENFEKVASLWGAYLGNKISPSQVADMMILFKVVRSLKAYHEDNYIDICGYAALANILKHDETKDSLTSEDISSTNEWIKHDGKGFPRSLNAADRVDYVVRKLPCNQKSHLAGELTWTWAEHYDKGSNAESGLDIIKWRLTLEK